MKPLKIFLKIFIQKLWKIHWSHNNNKKKISTQKENKDIYFNTTISECLTEYINGTTFLCLFFNFCLVFVEHSFMTYIQEKHLGKQCAISTKNIKRKSIDC